MFRFVGLVAENDGISFFEKVGRKFAERGIKGTLTYSAMRTIDVFQELYFDARHNVDTSGVTLPAAGQGEGYKGSLPGLVRASLRKLRIRYEDFTFIDFGSGKGRTLLIASEFPFRRVMGVEYCEDLHRVAARNIECYRGPRRCADMQAVCGDAREFPFPDGPLAIYLFNPFQEPVLRVLLENLRASLERMPRPVFLVYVRPLWAGALENAGFLERVAAHDSPLIANYNFAIYRSTISRTVAGPPQPA